MNILPQFVHPLWTSVKNFRNRPEANTRRSISIMLSQTSLLLFGAFMFGICVVDSTNSGICRKIEIRYDLSELNKLRYCRVIQGSLTIFSFENYTERHYENFTFPNLVEITDYLLLYYVHGLTSLMNLFPNLSVIRGNNLVMNYALVIFHVPQLQEIGLKSLTTISRGFVRIANNPVLCFVDTIDWVYIANGTQMEDHFFGSNRNSNLCNVCPTGKVLGVDGVDKNGSDIECPVSRVDPEKRHCWNAQTCQKICPDSCGGRACNDNLECCDEPCLGSCDAGRTNCTASRNLSMEPSNPPTCTNDLFSFDGIRCVSLVECHNIMYADDVGNWSSYIPFNGTCRRACPDFYSPIKINDGRRTCISCKGECKRECYGGIIQSIETAQRFRECAIVNGTLILDIRHGGQNIIRELELALSNIEEIVGALKITRSPPLISLSSLKKLRVIHGNVQESYSLFVTNNPNLERLFDHPVKIERGKLFFHFNPKLCYQSIYNIKKDVNDLKYFHHLAMDDVSTYSNGNELACTLTTLSAKVTTITPFGATVEVEPIKYEDMRVALGYILYLKEYPDANVSLFVNEDACSDGWRVEYTSQVKQKVQILLKDLRPHTQYAYYVKSHNVAWETYGGHTSILYFRTLPWKPDVIQNLKVSQNGSSSLIIKWDPPTVPNGELTHYIVRATLIRDDPEISDQRNYCDEPMPLNVRKEPVKTSIQSKPIGNHIANECVCDRLGALQMLKERSEYMEEILDFENVLQNLVYVKRTTIREYDEGRRRRRSIGATDEFVESRMVDGYYEEFYSNETRSTVRTFTLNRLKHFSMYLVSMQACRDFNDTNFHIETHCSEAFVENVRTGSIENADDIPYMEVRKSQNVDNNSSISNIYWPAPRNPNSLILTYTVIYKRVDLDNVRPVEHCISSQMYNQYNGEIPLLRLSHGNYSVSVKATSVRGDGRSTPPQTVVID